MSTLHASWLALFFCHTGMAALAFSMDRHYEQLTGRYEIPAALRWLLRCVGAAALVKSIVLCVAAWGAAVGVVAWLGWVSASALGVAWLLAYAPKSCALLVTLASLASLVWTGVRGFAA